MDQAEDSQANAKRLIHNNIKYLYDLCKNKDLNVPALKSLFWTKCKLMELRTKIHLPSEQYKTSTRCSRCFLDRGGNSNLQVQPMKLSKFEQKLVAKVEKNKNKVLTMFQQKCMQGIKKKYPDGLFFQQNQVVITCNSCKQESSIRMLKPKKIILQNGVKKLIKGKKKKLAKIKKDKNCGLKAEAVLQASLKTDKLTKKKKKKNVENKEGVKVGVQNKSEPPVKILEPTIKNQNQNQNNPQRTKPNQNNSQGTKPSTSTKFNRNDRMFATSDFIPLTTNYQGSKFKLSKKQKKPTVEKTVETKAKRKRNKNKGPKALSEKAKLELFLQNL